MDHTVPLVAQPFAKMHYPITLPLRDSLFSVALWKTFVFISMSKKSRVHVTDPNTQKILQIS